MVGCLLTYLGTYLLTYSGFESRQQSKIIKGRHKQGAAIKLKPADDKMSLLVAMRTTTCTSTLCGTATRPLSFTTFSASATST